MVMVHDIWTGTIYKSIYDSHGHISGWRKSDKENGYSIMNETQLTTPIANCNTLDTLVAQIPDRHILYGSTWEIPSWFPSDAVAGNWLIKITKHSNGAINLELDNVASTNKHYKAGYSYGNTFTGWDRITVGTTSVSPIVEATVVE